MKYNIRYRLNLMMELFFEYLGLSLPLATGIILLAAAFSQYKIYLNHNELEDGRITDGLCTNVYGIKFFKDNYYSSYWANYSFSVNNVPYTGKDILNEHVSIYELDRKINNKITIRYADNNPNHNKIAKNYKGEISLSFYWCSFLGFILTVFGLWFFIKKQ